MVSDLPPVDTRYPPFDARPLDLREFFIDNKHQHEACEAWHA
jgi:hypothetical protein